MYQALYRKYRPMKFFDVSGQRHITTTLQNEIIQQKIAHAYLFCGGRGTGKTTCARIFAKAVNCLNLQHGEPCNECSICREINNGSLMDVIEIDGASNTGVDNIREIRDEVVYTPSQARYKVYIIDEVHMLSTGAFNALLKTLEDPPEHVIFILATTDPNKVLPTVVSRCQRFDFRRLSPFDIQERLRYILGKEGCQGEEAALALLARLGDGAMRDAISLLDQCYSTGQEITLENVQKNLGLISQEVIQAMLGAVSRGETEKALFQMEHLRETATPNSVCTGLIDELRELMMIKGVQQAEKLLRRGAEEKHTLETLAKEFSLEQIMFCVSVLQETLNALAYAHNGWVSMELAIFRLCDPKLQDSTKALLLRISRLEQKIIALEGRGQWQGKEQEVAPSPPKGQEEAPPWEEPSPMLSISMEEPEEREVLEESLADKAAKNEEQSLPWEEILEELKNILDLSYVSLLRGAKAVQQQKDLIIYTQNPITEMRFSAAHAKEALLGCANGLLATRVERLVFEKNNQGTTAKKKEEDPFLKLLNNKSDMIKMME